MSKKLAGLLVTLLMLALICSTGLAVSNASKTGCDAEYEVSGTGMVILDDGGKIVGVIEPDEDCLKLGFQDAGKKSIKGIEDGKAVRRRAFAKVKLNANMEIVKGARECKVTVYLTDLDTVSEILGTDEPTSEEIIDATVYAISPCCNSSVLAGHMFLTKKTGRFEVGKVVFGCGQCVTLYAGDFDGDCSLELGFAPVVLSAPEPKDDDCHPCRPEPCRPQCRPVSTCVTYTTSVTTCYSGGWSYSGCGGYNPCGGLKGCGD